MLLMKTDVIASEVIVSLSLFIWKWYLKHYVKQNVKEIWLWLVWLPDENNQSKTSHHLNSIFMSQQPPLRHLCLPEAFYIWCSLNNKKQLIESWMLNLNVQALLPDIFISIGPLKGVAPLESLGSQQQLPFNILIYHLLKGSCHPEYFFHVLSWVYQWFIIVNEI